MTHTVNIITIITAFLITAASGYYLIPILRRITFGSSAYEDAPVWFRRKNGTPLMGGLMFIFGITSACAAGFILTDFFDPSIEKDNDELHRVAASLVFALLGGAVGFAEDYMKTVKHCSQKQLPILRIPICVIYMAALYLLEDGSTIIKVPFCSDLDIGILYYPVSIALLIAIIKCVDMTDRSDGLCASASTVFGVSWLMLFAAMKAPHGSVYASALAGGCTGFLLWDLYPSKAGMGKTGSVFLGCVAGSAALLTHEHILMLITALVFIANGLRKPAEKTKNSTSVTEKNKLSAFDEYRTAALFSCAGLALGAAANIIYALENR